MINYIKENFKGIDQIIFFLLIFSFFLPTIHFSYRYDHLFIYGLTLITLFRILYIFFKKEKKFFFLKKLFFENKNTITILIIYSFFIFLVILSLFKVLLSENYFEYLNQGITSLLVTLSNLDNYLQPICILFLATIFFLSKDREKNINIFLFSVVLIISLNSIYSLAEVLVVNLDENCGIFYSESQSYFCNFVSYVDRSYSGIEFSNAGGDYIDRSNETVSNKNQMLGNIFNSSSIGWISLNAGRSSGIFNMPLQGSSASGITLFFLFILYFRNNKIDNLNSLSDKFFITLFFLILIGIILPTSRVTSHLTIPGLIIIFIILRKDFKKFTIQNYFKYCLILFLMIFIFLGTLRWNGINGYYTHVIRITNIACKEFSLDCKFPQQILREKARVFEKNYALSKPVKIQQEIFVKKNNTSLEGSYSNEQIVTLYGLQEKDMEEEEKVSSDFKKKIRYYIYYLTGGRYGGTFTIPIKHVLDQKKYFGFGPITKLNFDQLHFYLLYHTGLVSLFLFMLILITILFIIIKNRNILKNQNIFLPTIFGFFVYFLASFGGPIYFMNRVNFLFFFLIVLVLSEIDNSKNKIND